MPDRLRQPRPRSERGPATRRAAALVLGLAVLCAAHPAGADDHALTEVRVGVWVASVHSTNALDGSVGVKFYVWWITSDPEFRPFEVMQILNGRSWTTQGVYRRVLDDGRHYTAGFVDATINHRFDFRDYPFDRQRIAIVIETPFTVEEVQLVPDTAQSLISDFVKLSGYDVEPLQLGVVVQDYASQFGLGDEGTSQFSRLVIGIDLVRQSGRLLVTLSVGFIVANLIAFLMYFIDVSALAARTGMVTSAIFAAVGNMYLLTSELNPASGSVLVDRIAGGTFAHIIVALLSSMIVERAARVDTNRASRINYTVFAIVTVVLSLVYWYALRDATH